MRGIRAHTLLEMLLVVGILAVLAGASVPRLRWLAASADFQNEVSRITGFLTEAQKRALFGHERFLIKIDTAQNSFLLYSSDASMLRDNVPIKSFKIVGEAQIESSASQLFFYSDGHVTPARVQLSAHGHSVVLSSEDQWGKIVVLNNAGADDHEQSF